MALHPPSSPVLEALIADARGTHRVTLRGPVVLGRGDTADFEVADRQVSREHCRIEPLPGEVVKVTDLGSANGTWAGGTEISQVRLRPGEEFRIGEACVIRILAGDSTAPAPARPGAQIRSAPSPAPNSPPAPAAPARAPARAGRPTPAPRVSRSAKTEVAPVPRPLAQDGESARERSRKEAVTRREPIAAPPAPASPAARHPAAKRPAGAPASPAAPSGPARVRVRRRAGIGGYVVLGSVLVVAALVIAVVASSGKDSEARELLDRAMASRAAGQEKAALALLNELLESYPDTEASRTATTEREALELRIQRRRDADRAFESLLIGDASVPGEELMARLHSTRIRFDDVLDEQQYASFERRAEAEAEKRSKALVSRTRQAVLLDIGAGAFGLAYDQIAEARLSPMLYGTGDAALDDLEKRLEIDARRAYGDVVLAAAGMDPQRAEQHLSRSVGRFLGTPHEGELRARLSMMRGLAARARRQIADGIVTEPTPAPPTPPALLDLLSRAEQRASRREYAEALPLFAEALESAAGDQREQVRLRQQRVVALAAVKAALIERIVRSPEMFRNLRVGESSKGNVVGATGKHIEISLGARARVYWDWARLKAERLARLLGRANLVGAVSVDAAEMFLEMRDVGRALAVLAERHDREPTLRRRIIELVAEARGMSAVPEGGFELYEGEFLTSEEKAEALYRQRLARLSEKVATASPGAWQESAAELASMGPLGVATREQALHQRLDGFREQAVEYVPFRREARERTRATLYQQLVERRKEALALIFDTVRYPYPYGPDQDQVQAEVDRLVDRVRRIWETPALDVAEDIPELKAALSDAVAVAAELSAEGEKAPGPAELLAEANAALDLRSPRSSPGDARLLQHFAEVRTHNDAQTAVISAPEREAHRITNEYRVMMGRRAVMIDDRLVNAARGHSSEMHAKGYFAHTSPTPGRASPSDRARLAGWGGGVSENIAQGQPTPEAVIRGWCHSSGHHRNILGAGHTHLGVGKAPEANVWTQNFGKGSSKPRSK